MAWKSDGTRLATISKDSKVRVYDPRSQVSPIQVSNNNVMYFFLLFFQNIGLKDLLLCQAIVYLKGNLRPQCPSLPLVEFLQIPASDLVFFHVFLPKLLQISVFLSFYAKETFCETLSK